MPWPVGLGPSAYTKKDRSLTELFAWRLNVSENNLNSTIQFSDSNFDIRINFRKYTQTKSCAAVEKLIDAFLSCRAALILIFIYFNTTWRTSVLSECRANSLHQTRPLFQQQRRDACWEVQSSNRSKADYVTVNQLQLQRPDIETADQ